jgi:hypothetical protein
MNMTQAKVWVIRKHNPFMYYTTVPDHSWTTELSSAYFFKSKALAEPKFAELLRKASGQDEIMEIWPVTITIE